MSAAMDPRASADEAAVRNAIAGIGIVSTLRDVQGFRRLWAADGVWQIGDPHPQRAEGIEEVVSMFERLWNGNDYFMQITTPGVVELDGDEARAQSLCQEFARGPDRFYRTNGVWTDRLRRDGDRWVFASRSYRYLWLDTSAFAGDVFPVAGPSGR